MRQPADAEKKHTVRQIFEGQLRRAELLGRTDEEALAGLAGPEVLEDVEAGAHVLAYLWGYLLTLDGMRAEGFSGAAAFTPEMIEAADRLFRWDLQPYEVRALRTLDLNLRHPPAEETDETPTAQKWPERKGG